MSGSEGNKGGRPSIYSDALIDPILKRIAAGEPLRKICDDADMPVCSTVMRRRRDKPEFAKLYGLAREDAADMFADLITTMANELVDRQEKATREEIQAVRVAKDALKWAARVLRRR